MSLFSRMCLSALCLTAASTGFARGGADLGSGGIDKKDIIVDCKQDDGDSWLEVIVFKSPRATDDNLYMQVIEHTADSEDVRFLNFEVVDQVMQADYKVSRGYFSKNLALQVDRLGLRIKGTLTSSNLPKIENLQCN